MGKSVLLQQITYTRQQEKGASRRVGRKVSDQIPLPLALTLTILRNQPLRLGGYSPKIGHDNLRLYDMRDMDLLRRRLVLHHLQVHPGARTYNLPSQRYHRHVIAVAYFNHEAIRIMEEQLIHVHSTFFYPLPHQINPHIRQLLLHQPHAFTLPSSNSVCFYCFLQQ